jgi:hypothetical protein
MVHGRLYTSGLLKTNYAVRLLEAEDVKRWSDKFAQLDKFLKYHGEEYCLVFASVKLLPHNTSVTLSIGPKVRHLSSLTGLSRECLTPPTTFRFLRPRERSSTTRST